MIIGWTVLGVFDFDISSIHKGWTGVRGGWSEFDDGTKFHVSVSFVDSWTEYFSPVRVVRMCVSIMVPFSLFYDVMMLGNVSCGLIMRVFFLIFFFYYLRLRCGKKNGTYVFPYFSFRNEILLCTGHCCTGELIFAVLESVCLLTWSEDKMIVEKSKVYALVLEKHKMNFIYWLR